MNYDRWYILRTKFPRAAMELDLVSGRVDLETGFPNPDFESDDMQDLIEYDVLEILDVIDKQGHSGFSHGYLLSLLIPLLKSKPITPLTGNDWEWDKPHWIGAEEQNKRCPSVFRRDDKTAYFIDGFAFSDDGGTTYYTSKESFKDITFPCSNNSLETEYVVLGNKDKEVDGQVAIKGFEEAL